MNVNSGNDILNADWPMCPRCHTPLHDAAALPEYDDGERDELACAVCGHTYEIRVHMVRSFNCYSLKEKQNV
jgi:hypothetical protein